MSGQLTVIGQTKNSSDPGKSKGRRQRILLMKPPFFTPWTPPLGIAILKTHLEAHGHSVTCVDQNTDFVLWGTHHKYFETIEREQGASFSDGYSKLWWILNAHFLSYTNDATVEMRKDLVRKVAPLFGIRCSDSIVDELDAVVLRFFKRLEDLVESYDLSQYSVVGTSTYTTSLGSSLFILRKIKDRYPHITTVMGGGVFADDLAVGSENLDTLIREYPYVDHVVLGEGELLFLDLIEGSLADKRVVSIEDLNNATIPMNEIPAPDFSDLDMGSYYHLTIEGARSCPFQCSFCSETIQWGDYRKKPPGFFVDQVVDLVNNNGNNAFFLGDSLMDPYIVQFSRELLDRGVDINYDGYLRADKLAGHRDKTRLWARSGLYRARMGIESASPTVLKAMYKMTTPQTIENALKSLAGAGIRTTTYWIVGFPGETEENFQETLDFIRENHRLIYELEAHPYSYYPYGQVGSRLFESFPIYPKEVTDITKFKVWEVKDIQPDRQERYERLRRISSLASSLGIPNIYTMVERFEADKRWQRLHPLARVVFKGTEIGRKEVNLKNKAIAAIDDTSYVKDEPSSSAVYVYRVSVAKRIDESILRRALGELVRWNEMLQIDLEDGWYRASSRAVDVDAGMLSVQRRNGEAAGEGDSDHLRASLEGLAKEMNARAGESLRLLLDVPSADDIESDLYLLLHHGMGDARSVVLLAEDLFRIYEQLDYGSEVRLLPTTKTYFEYIEENGIAQANSGAWTGEDSGDLNDLQTRDVDISPEIPKRLRPGGTGEDSWDPREIFVSAVARSMKEWESGQASHLEVVVDERLTEVPLNRTVGPLTGMRRLQLNGSSHSSSSNLLSNVRRQLRSNGHSDMAAARDCGGPRVVVNLEAMGDEPWMGGDVWKPRGFVALPSRARAPGTIQIEPLLSQEPPRVSVRHRRDPELAAAVDRLASSLSQAMETMIMGSQES